MSTTARHIAARCLLMRARRLARVTTRTYVEEMAAHGLSVGQFSLMVAIGTAPGVRAADLSAALDLERSTVSRELALLLREGLVQSEPVDGRSQALRLTDEGARRLDDALPAWERAQAAAEVQLGPLARLLLEEF
jgi:DNA-binding MarR family transcriptional regulator